MAEHEVTGAGGKQAYTLIQANPPVAYMKVDIRALLSALGGERLTSSATLSYMNVRTEARCAIISKTTAVTIGGGVASDTHLIAVLITKALTGTVVITGFADSDGAAKSLTFPAATVAGRYEFYGSLNTAGALTVTCSNAGEDDNVAILWQPAVI